MRWKGSVGQRCFTVFLGNIDVQMHCGRGRIRLWESTCKLVTNVGGYYDDLTTSKLFEANLGLEGCRSEV